MLSAEVGESIFVGDDALLRFVFAVCAPVISSTSFLERRRRVPGCLSGPRRFGAGSYSQWSARRAQFEQWGRVESHRILRERLKDKAQ